MEPGDPLPEAASAASGRSQSVRVVRFGARPMFVVLLLWACGEDLPPYQAGQRATSAAPDAHASEPPPPDSRRSKPGDIEPLDATLMTDAAGFDGSRSDGGARIPWPPSETPPWICPSSPPALTQCDGDVNIVDHGPLFPLGYGYRGAAFADGHVFAGGEVSGLNTWSVTASGALELVGGSSVPALTPVARGDTVYTLGEAHNLGHPFGTFRVFDVSQPKAPKVVGEYAELSGTLLPDSEPGTVYLWNQGSIRVMDVTDPTNPQLAGGWSVKSGGSLYSAAAAPGIVAFRGVYQYWFGLLDVRQPGAPSVIYGQQQPGPSAPPLPPTISGDGVEVTVHYDGDRFALLEVTTSAGTSNVPLLDLLGSADIEWLDDRVYLLSLEEDERYLEVLDVSNPMAPQSLSKTPMEQAWHLAPGPAGVLLVTGPAASVEAWSVVPEVPELLGVGTAATVSQPGAVTLDLEVAGDVLFMAGQEIYQHGGLWTASLCDPADPVLLQRVDIPGLGADLVAVDGTTAYVGGRGVGAFDVTDPSSPKLLGASPLPLEIHLEAMDARGGWLFGGQSKWKGAGLVVFDMQEPGSAVLAAEVPPPADGLELVKGVLTLDLSAVLVAWAGGIAKYDVSEPTQPSLMFHVPMQGYLDSIAVRDELVAGSLGKGGGYQLFHAPTGWDELVLMSTVEPLDCCRGVLLTQDYLVGRGPTLVDISVPTKPVVVATGPKGASPPHGEIVSYGNSLYTQGTDFMRRYEVSCPANKNP